MRPRPPFGGTDRNRFAIDAVKEIAQPLRLEFLDGIRGLAALYVTIFHAWMQIDFTASSGGEKWLVYLTSWMALGRESVAVFIVLSGFCLMLPVARSADAILPGGSKGFFYRRARRILPPYYAALVFSLVAMALVPRWWDTTGSWFQTMEPAFGTQTLVSHLFLVHNLNEALVFKINAPMWSVAMEWQIYFLFPFILLPLWRKLGLFATVAFGFLLGLAPLYFLGKLSWTAPWFIGHFAMGMAGAAVAFGGKPHEAKIRERMPWGLLALASLAALVALKLAGTVVSTSNWKFAFVSDLVVGVGSVALIVYCTRCLGRGQPSGVVRTLDGAAPVALGRFSYSLYLMHAPVLATFFLVVKPLQTSPLNSTLLLVGGGVPLCLLVSYGFYLCFERPFMVRKNPATTLRSSATAAIGDAAA
jgi:peptidoglycan/LPS O-acetylase OafA/YrhL